MYAFLKLLLLFQSIFSPKLAYFEVNRNKTNTLERKTEFFILAIE